MIQEEELIAEVTDLLSHLVEEGHLELATRHGPSSLAMDLSHVIEDDPNTDLEGWLLEHDEVIELYLDGDALHQRAKPLLKRLVHGDPTPKWNDALAKPLYDNTDDKSAWVVLSDWLQQEGDPRGELIAMQSRIGGAIQDESHALASLDVNDKLKASERTLRQRFKVFFYGMFASFEPETFEFVWRNGFIEKATVSGHDVDKLLGHPSSRFLKTLLVPDDVAAAAKPLSDGALVKFPSTLNHLEIGRSGKGRAADEDEEEEGKKKEKSVLTLGDASAINKLARVTKVNITSKFLAIRGELDLPAVTELSLWADELTLATARSFNLPRAESVAIACNNLDEESVAALKAFYESPPPKLKKLRLSVGRGADPVRPLIGTPLLKQLTELDLRESLDFEDVSWLETNTRFFEHLEVLNLRRCQLLAWRDKEGEKALLKLAKNVLLGNDPFEDAESDDEYGDDEYDEYGEDEDREDGDPSDYDDSDVVAEIPNEDVHPADDGGPVDDDETEDEPDEDAAGVDRDAPVEERERYDEPVE